MAHPPSQAHTHYVFVFESKGGEEAADIHVLRHVLKRLLREHGLRCISARQIVGACNGHHYRREYREGNQ
jgi:hypothetical protein